MKTDIFYLKRKLFSLRQNLYSKKINKNQFFLRTSALFNQYDKPVRAKCLINKIDRSTLSDKEFAQYSQIITQVEYKLISHVNVCALTMIVKNEQNNIKGALDSIESIMDEIVICDTGSTDNTIQYIELYGVTIINSQWQNDFSHARNRAIDACSSRWIMWMDADDRFDEHSTEHLLNLIASHKKQGAAFCIVNKRYNTSSLDFLQVRLFPRLNSVRFEQKIHEQIMYSLERNKIPFSCHPEIRIHHVGYQNPEISKQKARRNIRLLHREIKNNPHDSILHMNLADCYLLIGKIENSLKWYHKVLDNKQLHLKNLDVYTQSLITIAIINYNKNNLDTAQCCLQQCLRYDPKRNDAYFYLGKIFFDKKDVEKALEYFQKSATIQPGLRMVPIDTIKIKLDSIYYISEILISGTLYTDALNIINAAVAQYSNVPRFYSQIGKILMYQHKYKEAVYSLKISMQLNPSKNNDAIHVLQEILHNIKHSQEDRYRDKYTTKCCS